MITAAGDTDRRRHRDRERHWDRDREKQRQTDISVVATVLPMNDEHIQSRK